MGETNNIRIKRQFSIVGHSPNIVELRCGVWNPVSYTLTDASASDHLFNLLIRLDGSCSLAELAAAEGIPRSEVEALVDHLVKLNVVELGPSNALDHFLDHMGLMPRLVLDGGHELRPTLLVGEPDLCAQIEHALVGSLPNVDVSVTDPSDSAELVLAENDASWLMDGLEFQTKLTAFEAWRDKFLIVGMKVINPIRLRILNRVSLEYRLPWLHAALDGPFLFVGPLFVPHRTACYECFEMRVTMNLRQAESYQHYKRTLVEGRILHGVPPVEPVLLSLLAAHTALEALNYLLTRTTSTVGKVLAIYLPTMEFSFHEVLRVPGCPACGSVAERDAKELYFDLRTLLDRADAKHATA